MEQNLTNADYRLLKLVWSSEPVPSPVLCALAEKELGWKRTTTYTVIRRLCDKGYLQNEAAVVTAKVKQEAVRQAEGEAVLQRSFDGSLPCFLAAFLKAGSVSDRDAAELQKMLEDYRNAH